MGSFSACSADPSTKFKVNISLKLESTAAVSGSLNTLSFRITLKFWS